MKTTRLDTTLVTPKWRPARRHWYDLHTPAAGVIVIFCLLAIAGLVGKIQSTPSVLLQATPQLPIIIIASPLPQGPVPTAVPAAVVAATVPENVTQRAIGVFGAPDPTSYIGSVEAGRVFVPVARYGAEWTQVDMSGSGRVFVRTSDLYGVPELVDLKPAPAPIVVNQPIYVSVPSYAVPTQAPEQYQVASEPPADEPYLQTLAFTGDEEPISDALLREAQDR